MSKPYIADAILRPKPDNEDEESNSSPTDNNIHRLDSYLKTVSISKYPPVIQQAIKDIRYISETQREAQKDDLVCSKNKKFFFSNFFFHRKEKVGVLLLLSLIDVV